MSEVTEGNQCGAPQASTIGEPFAHSFGPSTAPSRKGPIAAGTKTSVRTVCCWVGRWHAMLCQPVAQSAFWDSNPVTYPWMQFCGFIHPGHTFPQADFSFQGSSLHHFLLSCRPLTDTSPQSSTWHLPLPLRRTDFPHLFLHGTLTLIKGHQRCLVAAPPPPAPRTPPSPSRLVWVTPSYSASSF